MTKEMAEKLAKKTAKIDIRRVEVLDAAARLFATKGFHATGMRELAHCLKIKAGSLYYHVESKDQLLNEVCEIGMQELTANLERARANTQPLTETIKAIVLGHARVIERYGNYLICYQNEHKHLSPTMREEMRLELILFHRRIEDVFQHAVTQRETRPVLAVRNARLALISILQYLSRLGAESNHPNLDKIAEGLSDILIYGLATK